MGLGTFKMGLRLSGGVRVWLVIIRVLSRFSALSKTLTCPKVSTSRKLVILSAPVRIGLKSYSKNGDRNRLSGIKREATDRPFRTRSTNWREMLFLASRGLASTSNWIVRL